MQESTETRQPFALLKVLATTKVVLVPIPQTANQTRQLAADTLEELHTQGEKLEKVDRDLNDVRSCTARSCCG